MDRYELLDEIGTNHYATIWKSYDTQMARYVAIMVLHDKFFQNPSRADAIWRDVKAMSEITDKNLVSVHDIVPDKRWVVMQLMRGTLGSMLEQSAISADLGRSVLRQILEALTSIHRAGRIHGDVKPNNILYNDEGRVRLSFSPGLYIGGTVPYRQDDQKYQAPELLKTDTFGEVGPAADLYCLGFSILALLKGPGFDSLFRGARLDPKTAWTRWHGDPNQALPPAATVVPGLPGDLAHVIDGLLKKNVSERYSSAEQVLKDLDDLPIELVEVKPEVPTETPKPQARPPKGGVGSTQLITGEAERPQTPIKRAAPVHAHRPQRGPVRGTAALKPWTKEWMNAKLQNPYIMAAVIALILLPVLLIGIAKFSSDSEAAGRTVQFRFESPGDNASITAWLDGQPVEVRDGVVVTTVPADRQEIALKAQADGYMTFAQNYRVADLSNEPVTIRLEKLVARNDDNEGKRQGGDGQGQDGGTDDGKPLIDHTVSSSVAVAPSGDTQEGSTKASSGGDSSKPENPGDPPHTDADKAKALLAQARQQILQGMHEPAKQKLNDAIGLVANLPELHRTRAIVHIALSNLDEALADLTAELAISPDDAVSHMLLGQVYANQARLDDAMQAFDKAITLDPKLEDAWAGRIFVHISQGRFQEALEDCNQLLALVPNHPVVLNSKGAALWRLGRHQEALEILDAALAEQPYYHEALFNRGCLLLDMGTTAKNQLDSRKYYERCIVDLSEVVKLRPEFAQGYYYRGRAYSESTRRSRSANDHLDAAIADFTRAIELQPDYPAAYRERSIVYQARGQVQQAQEDLKRAQSPNPTLGANQ